MALSDRPAERHGEMGGGFTARARGPGWWDVPSPVAAWPARDVVRHLVEWLPPFLRAGSGVELPCSPSVDDDRSARGRHTATPCRRRSTTPPPPTRGSPTPPTARGRRARPTARFSTPADFFPPWAPP